MPTKKVTTDRRKTINAIVVVIGSMAAAFFIGIETAGDVHIAVDQTRAGDAVLEGDFNGNGVLDPNDVSIALEIAKGYRVATEAELAADPSHDYRITVEDAMTILDKLSRLPTQPTVQL